MFRFIGKSQQVGSSLSILRSNQLLLLQKTFLCQKNHSTQASVPVDCPLESLQFRPEGLLTYGCLLLSLASFCVQAGNIISDYRDFYTYQHVVMVWTVVYHQLPGPLTILPNTAHHTEFNPGNK